MTLQHKDDMAKKEWFETWFDSPYYHMLYANRDEQEANLFITNIVNHIRLEPNSRVLDLACGKGRHARTLAELGFHVTGLDLASASIAAAKTYETERLQFDVHDMRKVYKQETFDAIFNLFTSFGYFDSMTDNAHVVKSVATMLNPEGFLIIDFMNAVKVVNTLVEKESKLASGITFDIQRRYDGAHIFKEIQFEAEGHAYSFTERVQAVRLNDFKSLLEAENFEIIRTFGDFNLNAFQEETSGRLILIAQKRS